MLQLTRDEAQGMVDDALILVLVAIALIAILLLLGTQTGKILSRIASGPMKAN